MSKCVNRAVSALDRGMAVWASQAEGAVRMAKPGPEQIKLESNYLAGTIKDCLADDKDHFDDPSKVLLKFHGIYEQEDRDVRKERKIAGLGSLYFLMVRSKLPGGKLTPEQYLVHDDLCDRFGNHTIRLTTRQGIQFHGVFKRNLKEHMRSLNEALVSTLAACGDVGRNVMCCPAPIRNNPVRDEMQKMADKVAAFLCPKTTSYHDIWVNGQHVTEEKKTEVVEPLYGKTYLPRKFKTSFTLPEDNCVDALADDASFIVDHKDGRIEGYDIMVGGGMGTTHGMEKTYPRLATPLCYATPDELIPILEAVIKVQRDNGNREDRKQARMKYLIDKWGQDKFRTTVAEYYGKPLAAPKGLQLNGWDDHLGWHPQGDGKWWLGIHIVAGRISDTPDAFIKKGLRAIVEKFRPNIRITAQQNILLCDIDPANRADIDKMLNEYNIHSLDQVSKLLRNAMACVAVPTCGLALTDSERVLAKMVHAIEVEIIKAGLASDDIIIHMTGCPNGCARPYSSDIGIVGRQPGKYSVLLGGNKLGTALNFEYQDLVPFDEIPNVLRGPLLFYKEARHEGERFGDFCRRQGLDNIRANVPV